MGNNTIAQVVLTFGLDDAVWFCPALFSIRVLKSNVAAKRAESPNNYELSKFT